MTQFAEFPVYGDQDGILDVAATKLSDSDVVSVLYTSGADSNTPVRGAVQTHKVA
jgi:hypothetical protein